MRSEAVCMVKRPSQQKAVGSLVLDHGASDFCLKICNLALEANLAHSFMRLSLVPRVLVLLSFLLGIPNPFKGYNISS